MLKGTTIVLAALTTASLSAGAPSVGNAAAPIYRDASYGVEDRVEDLLKRMTIEEKAGLMFQTSIQIGANYTLSEKTSTQNSTKNMLGAKYMSHFNLGSIVEEPAKVAEWYNLLQREAMSTRLGIPVTLSTDPRHHFGQTFGLSLGTGAFSQWPETIGLAALRDPELVRQFAQVAREEYVSVGFRAALHPQVDVATEPRWARVHGTWGEDAELTSELIAAYIKGFQGEKLGSHSVSTVTKHFPGNGPQEGGEDGHFPNGKNLTYPGNNFEYHLDPFKAALKAGARQMMPAYARPIGDMFEEELGFSFNKPLITGLLRGDLGFDGIVVTDWGLITDVSLAQFPWPARAWGVEQLSELERTQKVIEAGCDQFGGETRPELIVELVNKGLITEKRVDASVRRLLHEKFTLGLFEAPFIDPKVAEAVVGNPNFKRLGEETQRRAMTLLVNDKDILPLRDLAQKQTKVYVENINSTATETRNLLLVDSPEEADIAILRLAAPYDPRNGTIEAAFGHRTGTLEYDDKEKARQVAIYETVPTIVGIYMERPIAIPEVVESAAALIAEYGATDEAFLDVVLGDWEPEGKLPFDMPRSDAAVEESMSDVPFDTVDPVFRFGHGLRYKE